MPTPQETELKLLLPGIDAALAYRRLRQLPAFKGLRAQKKQLTNRYLDTPDHDLQHLRFALRLRQVRGLGGPQAARTESWIQTFKTAGTDHGGLSRRGEWNTPLSEPTLDLDALRAIAPHVHGLPDHWLEQLQPCFETRCARTTWRVHTAVGACIEVALDAGTLHAGGQVQPLLELELELQSGPLDALLELARDIATCVAVLPSDRSKAERGYAMAMGKGPLATRARLMGLPAGATPQQVAGLVLPEVWGQFTRNLDTLLHHHTPEVVHQTRVAWRRWRSLLKLLGPWLPPPPNTGVLNLLLAELGDLRDTDVALHETLPQWASAYTHHLGGHTTANTAAWSMALESLEQRSAYLCDQVRTHLGTPQTGACLLEMVIWLDHAVKTVPPKAPHNWVVQRLQPWYRLAYKHLSAPGVGLEVQHQGRLLAKRVRYAAEAVVSSLDKPQRRRVNRWLARASGWQVGVGVHRDTQQAAHVLRLAGAPAAVTAFMAGVGAGALKIQGCSTTPASGSTP